MPQSKYCLKLITPDNHGVGLQVNISLSHLRWFALLHESLTLFSFYSLYQIMLPFLLLYLIPVRCDVFTTVSLMLLRTPPNLCFSLSCYCLQATQDFHHSFLTCCYCFIFISKAFLSNGSVIHYCRWQVPTVKLSRDQHLKCQSTVLTWEHTKYLCLLCGISEEKEAGVYCYDDICFCPKALHTKVTSS